MAPVYRPFHLACREPGELAGAGRLAACLCHRKRRLTRSADGASLPGMARALGPALGNGIRRRCPACGRGALFAGYLRPVAACAGCGEALGHIRADDFPPYIALLVAGHVVIPLILFAEQAWAPALWLQATVWPLLALALVAVLLPVAKGGVLATMWALGLTGNERQEEPGSERDRRP